MKKIQFIIEKVSWRRRSSSGVHTQFFLSSTHNSTEVLPGCRFAFHGWFCNDDTKPTVKYYMHDIHRYVYLYRNITLDNWSFVTYKYCASVIYNDKRKVYSKVEFHRIVEL